MDEFVVLINKTSGTVLRLGEEKVRALLTERLGSRLASLELLETQDIQKTLQNLASQKPAGILVGGGDGTAMAAAEILGPAGVPFSVLPLGTMNFLAQDLGSAPTFEQTIERFDRLTHDKIDVGLCNGRMFLCSAVIGFVPESAVVREELREAVTVETMARFVSTIRRGLGGEDRRSLILKRREGEDAHRLETTSLIISNNAFVKTPSSGNERFLRETLTDGKLAVYSAAPKDIIDGLKIALGLWQGDWQEQESIMSFQTPELIVDTPEREILVSLDGEPVPMKTPLRFRVSPRSLPVLRMELAA